MVLKFTISSTSSETTATLIATAVYYNRSITTVTRYTKANGTKRKDTQLFAGVRCYISNYLS